MKDRINVVELYAGTGRASDPFRAWRRANVSLLVDWDAHARATFISNFPDANYQLADLGRTRPATLKRMAGRKIDVLLGCPPCQGFSESGFREPDDPRNDHLLHFAKCAALLKPAVLGMENVPTAALSPHFRGATEILESAGYRWTAGVLNAALYGSAQCRHRLVLIAVRSELGVEPKLPAPTHFPFGRYFDYRSQTMRSYEDLDDAFLGTPTGAFRAAQLLDPKFARARPCLPIVKLESVLAGLPRIGTEQAERLSHSQWAHKPAILAKMTSVPEGGRRTTTRKYFGAAYARLHRKGLSRTITTYFPNAGSGRYWHPTKNRSITLREAARIQGFPDHFQFIGGATGSNAVLVGNALDAALASSTYRQIRKIIEKSKR